MGSIDGVEAIRMEVVLVLGRPLGIFQPWMLGLKSKTRRTGREDGMRWRCPHQRRHWDIFKSHLAICLKRQVCNSCVLPAMTVKRHGYWPNKHRTNLRPRRPKWKEVCSTSHTKIEIPTSGSGSGQSHIYNQNCKNNETVLGRAYQPPQRRPLDLCVTTWRPHNKKIRQGRPAKRWRYDLDKYWSDTIWQRTAQYRVIWRRHAEAFAGHNGCLMMMMMMIAHYTQTAALEMQLDRCASLRQNGTGAVLDWRWPSICRLDLERTGSVVELLTDCAQGLVVGKQSWWYGVISTTPSRWIATAGSHRRWPTSSRPVRLTTVTERAKACARKWEKIVWRTWQKKKKTHNMPLMGSRNISAAT